MNTEQMNRLKLIIPVNLTVFVMCLVSFHYYITYGLMFAIIAQILLWSFGFMAIHEARDIKGGNEI